MEFSWAFWNDAHHISLSRQAGSIHRHAGLCGSVGLCPPSVAGGAVAPWQAQKDASARTPVVKATRMGNSRPIRQGSFDEISRLPAAG